MKTAYLCVVLVLAWPYFCSDFLFGRFLLFFRSTAAAVVGDTGVSAEETLELVRGKHVPRTRSAASARSPFFLDVFKDDEFSHIICMSTGLPY